MMKKALALLFCCVSFSAIAQSETEFEHFVLQDNHKVIIQGGYFEQDTQAENEAFSYSLKYDGSYQFSVPTTEWPDWDVFLRPWLVASSSEQLSDSFSSDQQFEGVYLEAREFYVRKNRLFNMASLNMSVGRQQYGDYYGIWWDDSIESIKLNVDKTLYGGFLALGQQFYNYNTDTNELNNNQKDISYLFGEAWYRHNSNIVSGVRWFGQYDHSVENDTEVSDFQGVKIGYFINARIAVNKQHELTLYGDFAVIGGEYETINSGSSFINAQEDVQGWALVTELYDQFYVDGHRFKIGARLGMTDEPDNAFSGHVLSPIQTDRVSKTAQYSTGLSGTMVDNKLSNVRFYGAMAEYQIDDRSHLELLAFNIERINTDVALVASIADSYAEGDGKTIGQSYEAFYFLELFPKRVKEREVSVDLLVSAGFFSGGDAIEGSPDDYRVSIGLNATF